MQPEGKIIRVKGATSGIAYGTSRRLLEACAHLIAVARNTARLAAMAPQRATPLAFDLLGQNLIIDGGYSVF
jgi:NADP-dependent 3-hydroxy acid dehydrogenase YdfG